MPAKVIHLENRQDFKELIKKAKQVIVKASADWCGPCKQITPYFDEWVEKYFKKEVFIVKLDVDVGRDLATFLKVESIPQIFYFKDGYLDKTVVGADMENIDKLLRKVHKEMN